MELHKPFIKKEKLRKSVVHTPTRKEYDNLMQVLECMGFELGQEDPPTYTDFYHIYQEDTGVLVGYPIIYVGSKIRYEKDKRRITSPDKFYNKYGITLEEISKMNNYFDKYNPDRESKIGGR